MGLVRRGAFVAIAAAACAAGVSASIASCTYGDYDGSFDSAGLEIATQPTESGTSTVPPVIVRVVSTATTTTTVATTDQVFEVDVPAHAYPADVTITITTLATRQINANFEVPVYQVAVAPDMPATLPVQVQFHGNGSAGNSNPSMPLEAAVLANGTANAMAIVGTTGGGSGGGFNTILWGITKSVSATYTLDYFTEGNSTQGQTLQESSLKNCILDCCNIPKPGQGAGGTQGQLAGTRFGCVCGSTPPNLDCFAQRCPDIATTAQRCLDLQLQTNGTLACQPGGVTCVAPGSVCCYAKNGGSNMNLSCTGPTGTFNGNQPCQYVERCTATSQCPNGSVCCAFDDETICSTACPPGRQTCTVGSPTECDGGACLGQGTDAGRCTIGTCGAAIAACAN